MCRRIVIVVIRGYGVVCVCSFALARIRAMVSGCSRDRVKGTEVLRTGLRVLLRRKVAH